MPGQLENRNIQRRMLIHTVRRHKGDFGALEIATATPLEMLRMHTTEHLDHPDKHDHDVEDVTP